MPDNNLPKMRPQLDLPTTDATPNERFQNATLRPILKMQHDWLVEIFKNYLQKRKNPLPNLSKKQRLDYIEQAVRVDLKFKNRLIGGIIGHFTATELTHFFIQETELTRRLTDLVVQRLQSAVSDF